MSNTRLFEMIATGTLADVKRSIKAGADLIETNGQGLTPIEFAAQLNKLEIVSLIAKLRLTNAEDKAKYGAVLLKMVAKNHENIVKDLLSAKTPLENLHNRKLNNCFHIAIKLKNSFYA